MKMKQTYPHNRELPVIEIEGISFYVDAYQSEISEVNNRKNSIHCVEMVMFDDHAEFMLNTKTRQIYRGRCDLPLPEGVKLVWIRPLMSIDPDGMDLFYEKKYGSWHDNNAELPIMEIGGHQFYVDDYRNCFREVRNRWNRIAFKKVQLINGELALYFRKDLRNAAFPHEIEEFKLSGGSQIEVVRMPNGYDLMGMLKAHKKEMAPRRVVYEMDNGSLKRKGKGI